MQSTDPFDPAQIKLSPRQRFDRLPLTKQAAIVVPVLVVILAAAVVVGLLNRDEKPTQSEVRNYAYLACVQAVTGEASSFDLNEDPTATVESTGGGDYDVNLDGRLTCIVHHSGDQYEVLNTP